ncbi:MAG: hypothetical protein HGB37_04065 [Candidatus Moranbacteria bacterium]|nr:hypothetical protein [Candidatus Moranbacteria bacterium]
MKRIIITISAVASIVLFVSILILISNIGNSGSDAAKSAGYSDRRSTATVPIAPTNVAATSDTKTTSSNTAATTTAKTVVPQPTRTTKTS